MYKTLAYLKFLFKSTNQHGVHSPFIYAFVTKCLYSKPKFKIEKHLSKTDHLIQRSISYFNATRTINLNTNTLTKKKYDVISFDAKQKVNFDIKNIFKHIHNDTVLIIKNNYINKKAYQNWQAIKNQKTTTVTVDCFNISFVFFRKEQAKEHFRIRL